MYPGIDLEGYTIKENAYCDPYGTRYENLLEAANQCTADPSCEMIFQLGTTKNYYTCLKSDGAVVKVSSTGSRLYIKSNYLLIWYYIAIVLLKYHES